MNHLIIIVPVNPTIKKENLQLDKICHICLLEQKNIQPMSEPVSNMLTECASIQYPLGQSLICENCQSEVKKWHSFKQTVHKSFQICKEMLASTASKVDKIAHIPICKIENEDSLGEQINTAQEDSKDIATDCSDAENVDQFETGAESHQADERYKCEICDTICKSELSLLIHRKRFCGKAPRDHKCDICSTTFKNANRLWYHKHTRGICQIKQFPCPNCSQTFPMKRSLNLHIQIYHNKHPQFTCPHCSKKYKVKHTMVQHIKASHSGSLNKWVCSVCGLQFTSSATLKVHMRKHTGERPFICEYCSKGFMKKEHLLVHVRRHTGERPYKCEHCDKGYAALSSLIRHRRTHTGERPYKCQSCSQSFADRSNCIKHEKMH